MKKDRKPKREGEQTMNTTDIIILEEMSAITIIVARERRKIKEVLKKEIEVILPEKTKIMAEMIKIDLRHTKEVIAMIKITFRTDNKKVE